MRAFLLLAFLVARASFAADCLRADASESITLRGVIEYKYDVGSSTTFSIFLNLPSSICVEGSNYDGSPFKYEKLDSIQLGIPANLNKALRPGDRVALRGKLSGPAINDILARVTFSLREVL